jgi:RNA polymerase sigma-70 factor (ECF subfamily)
MTALALAAILAEATESPGVRIALAPVDTVERARRGDRRAFDELYRIHVGDVYRRIARLCGPDPEREDLVQQVFLEVFRGLPAFRGEAAFSTWLYRIVVRVAYEHLKKRRRRPVDPLDADALEALVLASESPEQAARRRQELALALGFLARLAPKKRIAFVLREVEGLSLEEIGQLVHAKAPAVGQRVKHAQRELAAMIERDEKRRRGR